jgi:hypothetical protein
MTSWGATKAKAQFSAVLDKAETEGPQLVQRRKKRFIVVTEEHFKSRVSTPESEAKIEPFVSAWDALRPPPELCFDYDFPRIKSKPRAAKF